MTSLAHLQKEISLDEAARVSLGALRDGNPTRTSFGFVT